MASSLRRFPLPAQLITITASLCCLETQDCSLYFYFFFCDQSFLHTYSFHTGVRLSQWVPNKPKICSVVVKAASLEWVRSVAWAQLHISCIFVACGAAMSNRWHLIWKSTPGTWILSILLGSTQSIKLLGVSYVTPIIHHKNANTLVGMSDWLIACPLPRTS